MSLVAVIVIAVMAWQSSLGDVGAGIVPGGSQSLAPCPVRVAPTPVEELGDSSVLRGCDAEGSTVIFPDGHLETVEAVGASMARNVGDVRYTVDNWGVLGVVAVRQDASSTQFWGTREGVSRQIRFEGAGIAVSERS